jgi:formylglycine-generating enzyme required for sulfatase activity/tRNA A-37 threonylcarbamoyl transferase component Bud32
MVCTGDRAISSLMAGDRFVVHSSCGMGTRDVDWVPPESFDEYRLLRTLGRGSMGQVWLAHDTVLDRRVAVKFISELPAHAAVRQRFLIEARAAARVQHPNIIAIYRVGEIGPRPFLISEYVRGESLDRIARPVAGPRLLPIALGLARGLAAAHRRGVLHRDIKPANAILSDSGDVKLLDFGLAKLFRDVAEPPPDLAKRPELRGDPTMPLRGAGERNPAPAPDAPSAGRARPPTTLDGIEPASAPVAAHDGIAPAELTMTGAVIGTPAYMPPEAWRGETATPRSDVYSLGALLYELAAGDPPHRADAHADAHAALRSAALETDARPLAVAVPGVDPRFAAIVDRCLVRDPARRFASGAALCEALEALAAADPSLALARPRRRRWHHLGGRRALLAAAATIAALGIALVAAHLPGGEPPSSPGAGCPASMVAVPAGRFAMGSPEGVGDADEHPRHQVTLPAYCIDRTEVTVMAYAVCVAAGACSAPPRTVKWSAYSPQNASRYGAWCNGSDRPGHPINCIDWDAAAAYCAWRGARLPTEAEWEYAARGGDDRVYPWGDEPPSATRLDLCGTECAAMARRALDEDWTPMYDADDGWGTTAPVGSYPAGASRSGALDMAGNVWEWTSDWYGPYAPAAQADPQGAASGTSRVSRGAGWATRGRNRARAADRNWLDPSARDCDLGFRCARSGR